MANVKQIFGVQAPAKNNFSTPARQSMDALEDYDIKKNINTVEGTVEKVPVNDNDIANKKYVDDNTGGTPSAGTVTIPVLGTPTYDNLQDYLNKESSTIYTGFAVTDSGSGEVDIGSGTAFIKTTDSDIGESISIDCTGSDNFPLTDNTLNFIYLDYNAGTPIINKTADIYSIDLHTQIPIATVYRAGNTLHISNIPANFTDNEMKQAFRLFETYGRRRVAGMVTGETGTRNLTVSAGVAYYAHHRSTTPAEDTSDTSTFRYWYNNGSWTTIEDSTQIDNTQYNDYGVGLDDLGVAKYGVHWVYMHDDGDFHVVYGQTGTNTIAQALLEGVPANMPAEVTTTGILIAKIIILNGAATFYNISTPWEETFTTSGVTDHTSLSNIGINTHVQIDTSITATGLNTAARHTQGTDTTLGTGAVAADHGLAGSDMIVNVCYGTSATPPTASTTTEGALYVQYTA